MAAANDRISGTNHYREYPAPAGLAGWVECAWSGDVNTPAPAMPVRPDGCVDIVFSPRDGLRVIGAMTVEQHVDQHPDSPSSGVRFHPGMARRFLGISAAELTDKAIALEGLIGSTAREIERRLHGIRTSAERARFLTDALPVPGEAPGVVHRAISAINRARGLVDLDLICDQANLSPRQFRRRCLEESGLAPKHLCRILRFRHALSLAWSSAGDWAGIAAEAGYFDQAHLIRDFREFTGRTPTRLDLA